MNIFMTEKKLCLLDRDGVLNVDKAYLCKTEDVEWVPGSREAIAWLNRQGFQVVGQYDVDCDCRKPKPGMILQALNDFDVKPCNAFLAGDSPRDVEAAEAAGVKGFLYTGGNLLDFIQKIVWNLKLAEN